MVLGRSVFKDLPSARIFLPPCKQPLKERFSKLNRQLYNYIARQFWGETSKPTIVISLFQFSPLTSMLFLTILLANLVNWHWEGRVTRPVYRYLCRYVHLTILTLLSCLNHSQTFPLPPHQCCSATETKAGSSSSLQSNIDWGVGGGEGLLLFRQFIP